MQGSEVERRIEELHATMRSCRKNHEVERQNNQPLLRGRVASSRRWLESLPFGPRHFHANVLRAVAGRNQAAEGYGRTRSEALDDLERRIQLQGS